MGRRILCFIIIFSYLLCGSNASVYGCEFLGSIIEEYKLSETSEVQAEEFEIQSTEEWKYSIQNDEACIEEYTGSDTTLSIPDNIDGYQVTKIKSGFLAGKNVIKVYIPKTITSASNAFLFSKIESIEFEEGIETIPQYICYSASKLEKVVIPNSVKKISEYAFCDTNISEIQLPSGITYLGMGVISRTPIKSVYIPKTITSAYYAFDSSNIESIEFEEGMEIIPQSICKNASKLEKAVIPDSVKTINDYAFSDTNISEIQLPSGITYLGTGVISRTPIKSVYIPKTITSALSAFAYSNIESIEFEEGMEIIPQSICNSASKLEKVVIPDSVKKINDYAFRNTNISEIQLPSGITYLGKEVIFCTPIKSVYIPKTITSALSAFAYSNIESIEFEEGMEIIPQKICYSASKLEKVVIPNSVKTINDYAFSDTNISEIQLPSGITYLGRGVISRTPIKSVYIPKTITYALSAFAYSNIESIEFEEGMEIIPQSICENASKLEKAVIPDSVKTINAYAFYNTFLRDIYYAGNENEWNSNKFDSYVKPVSTAKKHYNSYYNIFCNNEFTIEQSRLYPTEVIFECNNIKTDVLHKTEYVKKEDGPFSLQCISDANSIIEKYELYHASLLIGTSTDGNFKNISSDNMFVSGTYTIRIIGTDGNVVCVPLKLYVKEFSALVPQELSLFGSGFTWKLPEEFPLIGGDELSLDIADLPVDCIVEGDKIKININLKNGYLESTDPEKLNKSNNILKTLESIGKNDGNKNKKTLKEMIKEERKGKLPGVKNFDVKYSVVGYLEGNVDKNTASGVIVVSVSGNYDFTKIISSPITLYIPITIDVSVVAKGSLTGKVSYDFRNSKFSGGGLDYNTSASLSPYIAVGVGEYLSGGVYGEASLGSAIRILGKDAGLKKIYMTGELGVKGYIAKKSVSLTLLSLDDLKKKWPTDCIRDGEFLIYSSEGSSLYKSIKTSFNTATISPDDEETFIFKTCEEESSIYNTSPEEFEPIIANAYGAAQPQIISYGGTTLFVYVDYDTTRELSNQTVIKYMVYDDNEGMFSTPRIMLDDKTADCEPIVYSDRTGIYCAFLDSNTEYDDNTDPEMSDYLSSLGVTVCRYNNETNNFEEIGKFQVDDSYCYKLALYRNSDGLILSWVQNPENVIWGLSQDKCNKIYSVNLENQSNQPKEVANGLPCVTNIYGGVVGGKDYFIYCTDPDNNLATNEKTVYAVCDGTTKQIMSGNISNLRIVKNPCKEGNTFMYIEDGLLKMKDNINAEPQRIYEEISGIGSYQVSDNAIYYLVTENGTRNIGALVWNNSSWNNTNLTDSNNYIDSFSVCGDKAVYLETQASLYSETSSGELETVSNIYKLDTLKIDKGNIADIEFEPEDVKLGRELPLTIYVTNQGTTAINSLKFVFRNNNSDYDRIVNKEVTILPGEGKDIELMISVPEDVSSLKYDVELYADTETTENILLGEAYELNLGFTDISVDTAYISRETHQKPVLETVVTNVSSVPANVKTVVSDSEGNVYMTKEENFEAGQSIKYNLNVESIIPTDGSFKVLTATVTSDVEEYYEYNNTSSKSIFEMPIAEIQAEKADENGDITGFKGNLSWNITSDGVATIGKDSEIPANIWFNDRAEKIEKIIVSKDVDKIKSEAFANCSSLQNIVIENPDCEIEENALPLDIVVISKSDSKVNDYAINNGYSFADINASNSVYAVSVTLKDDIGLNFFVNLTKEIVSDNESYILLGDKKYKIAEAEIGYEDNGIEYYKFTKNLSPAEINDDIVIKLFDGNGKQRLCYTTSCSNYLDKLYQNTSDDDIKKLVLSLKDYNYYSQKYFKYNMNNVGTPSNSVVAVNSSIFDNYKQVSSGTVTGLSYYGSSLILKNNISIRHYFIINNSAIEDYHFTVDGEEVNPVLKSGNIYYVDIANIMPTKLLEDYKLMASRGSESFSLKYGVMSYANTMIHSVASIANNDLTNLIKSIYLYADAVDKINK